MSLNDTVAMTLKTVDVFLARKAARIVHSLGHDVASALVAELHALPTLEDEQVLFSDADAAACITRLRSEGIEEIVVKRGAQGCVISVAGDCIEVPPLKVVQPVDTTAAGDSFNAGYIAARLRGASPVDAARAGHRLAGAVIMVAGAVIPREAMPADLVEMGAAS